MRLKAKVIFSSMVIGVLLLGTGGVSAESGAVIPTPVAAGVTVQAAAVRYAKPDGATMGSCDSWANACDLQYALGTVAIYGDEIWVAGGVYTPGVALTATFALIDMALYGGFAMTETIRTQRNWDANVTVLSGDIAGDDITDANGIVTSTANIQGNNAYHVVTSRGGINPVIIDGFTITGGNTIGVAAPNNCGGGMYNDYGSSPTLANVTFSGNIADNGGGMYNYYGNPTLTNVTFSGNIATDYGGGMENYNSSPVLTNATFNDNSAPRGGGMVNYSSSNPTLTNVTFSGNSAVDYGGGVFNGSDSSPALTNITFSGNSATYGGGMASNGGSPVLTNVTFSGNSADYGSGMHYVGDNLRVRNTLFVKGTAGDNCYGNAFAAGSTTNLANDASCGSSTVQSANIHLGVLGNYGGSTQTIPLLFGSVAINAGNPAYCPAADQRGIKRNGQCDIGAFEAQILYLPAILKNNEFFFEGPVEAEDNDVYTSANGPLRFGRDYTGLFDDEKDFFSVRLPTAGTLNVTVTRPASPSPTTLPLQLQLLYWNGNQLVVAASRTGTDALGRQITYPGAPAGWYYLYLNAGTGTPTNQPYTVQVTY